MRVLFPILSLHFQTRLLNWNLSSSHMRKCFPPPQQEGESSCMALIVKFTLVFTPLVLNCHCCPCERCVLFCVTTPCKFWNNVLQCGWVPNWRHHPPNKLGTVCKCTVQVLEGLVDELKTTVSMHWVVVCPRSLSHSCQLLQVVSTSCC